MQSALSDSSITPSATMLNEMQGNNETYYRMAMRKAQQHREFFLSTELDKTITEHYRQLADLSYKQQTAEEKNDQLSFDDYLANYWKSSKTEQ
jgi:glutamate--cysteine ligase